MSLLLLRNTSIASYRYVSRVYSSCNILAQRRSISVDTPQNKPPINSPTKKPKSMWFPVIIGSFVFGSITYFINQLRNEALERVEEKKSRSIGKPAIGGSFELIDTKGNIFKSESLLGKWALIYFGFTNCPDVCPEELEKIVNVVDRLEKRNIKITPLFISVDPERDTAELIGKYLSEFSEKFIGLTGTKEQVDKATRCYRVYYSVGPKDQDNDYIVDHTIISYLINPKGELEDYYSQTRTEDDMFSTIQLKIGMFDKNNKTS